MTKRLLIATILLATVFAVPAVGVWHIGPPSMVRLRVAGPGDPPTSNTPSPVPLVRSEGLTRDQITMS